VQPLPWRARLPIRGGETCGRGDIVKSINKFVASAALLVGVLVFSGKAEGQVIVTSGYYTTPVYSSYYAPSYSGWYYDGYRPYYSGYSYPYYGGYYSMYYPFSRYSYPYNGGYYNRPGVYVGYSGWW
jgi:hypothetical protein